MWRLGRKVEAAPLCSRRVRESLAVALQRRARARDRSAAAVSVAPRRGRGRRAGLFRRRPASRRWPSPAACSSRCRRSLLFCARIGRAFVLAVTFACVSAGFFSAAWRAARVDAPILPRLGIGFLTGFVEEVDLRRAGARFIVRVASAEGLPGDVTPARVRLTTRGEPRFAAGDFIALKARLLPPAHAALPGGYDFARDAYFLRLGGVGNALGRIDVVAPPDPAPHLAALLRRARSRAQRAGAARLSPVGGRRRRDRGRHGDRQARLSFRRSEGDDPTRRHFSHHHHFRRFR